MQFLCSLLLFKKYIYINICRSLQRHCNTFEHWNKATENQIKSFNFVTVLFIPKPQDVYLTCRQAEKSLLILERSGKLIEFQFTKKNETNLGTEISFTFIFSTAIKTNLSHIHYGLGIFQRDFQLSRIYINTERTKLAQCLLFF